MATFLLTFNDGSSESVRAAPNTSPEELLRLANEQRERRTGTAIGEARPRRPEPEPPISEDNLARLRAQLKPEEAGIFENLATGFGAGAVGIGETASLGLASLMEEGDELAARRKIKGIADSLRPEGGDPDAISYGLGQALGSIVGLAAPVAGIAALPISGAGAAALGTGLTLAGAAGAGEARERARAETTTPEERRTATQLGTLVGFTEILPISRFVKFFDLPAVNKLVDTFGVEEVNRLGTRIKNAAKTGGAEGAQEVTAEFFQNAIERGYNIDQDLIEGLVPAGGYGAGAGAIVQAVVDLFTKGRRIGDTGPQDVPTEDKPRIRTPAYQVLENQTVDDVIKSGIPENDIRNALAEVTGEQVRAAKVSGEKQRVSASEFAEFVAQKKAPIKDVVEETTETVKDEATFSGTVPLKHGSSEGDLTQFIDPEDVKPGARYGENIYGDDVLYLGEKDSPFVSEEGMYGYEPPPFVYDVEAKFDKAFVLTPNTIDTLLDILPQDNSMKDSLVIKNTLKEKGYDGLIIRGFDFDNPAIREEFYGETTATVSGREPSVFRGYKGIPFDVLQEQVISFKPKQNKILGRPKKQRGYQRNIEERQSLGDERAARSDQNQRLVNRIVAETNADPKLAEEFERDGPAKYIRKRRKELGEDRFFRVYLSEEGDVAPRAEAVAEETDATDVKNEPINKDVLDMLGLAPSSAIGKSLLGRDLTRPGPRKELQKYAKTASEDVQAKVDSALANIGQRDLPDEVIINVPGKIRKGITDKELKEADIKKLDDEWDAWFDEAKEGGEKRIEKTIAGRLDNLVGKDNPLTTEDTFKILELVKAPRPSAKTKAAGTDKAKAQIFLGKMSRPADSLYLALSDVTNQNVVDTDKLKQSTTTIAKFFQDTGKTNATATLRWAKKNLSPQANKWINSTREELSSREKELKKYEGATVALDSMNAPQGQEQRETPQESYAKAKAREAQAPGPVVDVPLEKYLTEQILKLNKGIDDNGRIADAYLSVSDTITLQTPLDADAEAAAREGNLKEALLATARTTPNTRLKTIANKLAKFVGDTKIEVVPDSQMDTLVRALFKDGDIKDPVNGMYIPKNRGPLPSDTIVLNEGTQNGMAVVTLLHEATHAATLKKFIEGRNTNSRLYRQIDALYKNAKENLDQVQGTEEIEEFIAEAFSNPAFQQKLALLPVPKEARSGFQKFIDVIRSLFFLDKIERTSLNQSDALISKLLAPSRPSGSDIGPVTSMSVTNGTMGKMMNNATEIQKIQAKAEQAKPLTQLYDRFHTFMTSTASKKAKIGFTYGLNTRMLSQIGTGLFKLPQFEQLNTLIAQQEGEINKFTTTIKATAMELAKWEKANPDKVTLFNQLVHNSSINGVDFRKKESEYAVDPNAKPEEQGSQRKKLKYYKDNKADYIALGGEGRRQYKEVFKVYSSILERMEEGILNHVNTFVEDKKTAGRLGNIVKTQLFNRAIIDPYVPLTREGDFWLGYIVDGEQAYQPFTTKNARTSFREMLEQEPKLDKASVVEFDGMETFNIDSVPPQSWVGQVVKALKESKADQEVIEKIVQLYIETVPESSFMKSLQGRLNREGFQQSVLRGLNIRAFDMARQAINSKYTREIYKLKDSLEATLKERVGKANNLRSQPKDSVVVKDFENKFGPDFKKELALSLYTNENKTVLENTFAWRTRQSTNPAHDMMERIAIGANQLTFIGTMGVNVSSALLQTAGIPMVLYPLLAAKVGWSNAGGNILMAMRIFAGSGMERYVTTAGGRKTQLREAYIGAPSMDNYYLEEDGQLSTRTDLQLDNTKPFFQRKDKQGNVIVSFTQQELIEDVKDLVQTSADRSLLNRTIHSEMIGLDVSGQKEATEVGQAWKDFNTLTAYPFQMGDRSQRQVTLLASYLTEVERLTKDPKPDVANLTQQDIKQRAIEVAIEETEQTGGTNLLAQAPPIAQRHIGRVMMMFKTYGFSVYYHQIKLMADYIAAKYKGDEKGAKIARTQVAGTFAMTAAMSGDMGITLYGAVIGLLDLFLTDDDEETYDSWVRKNLGEGVYKGGVNFVFEQLGIPLDVSARIGLANLIISSNRYNFDRSMEESIVDALGGAAWSTLRRTQRGVEKLLDGEFQRGIEDVLPVSVSNMLKAGRFASEGALTRRGDPITTDFSAGTIAAKFFGFAPAEYTRAQEVAQDVKRIDKAVNRKRSRLLKRYYIASRMGDYQEVIKVRKEIAEFNKKHARLGPKVPITQETITRSLAQHTRTTEQMFNGVQLSPNVRDALRMFAAEYDRGPTFF